MSRNVQRIALAVAGVLLSCAALIAAGTPSRDETRPHIRIQHRLAAK